MSDGQLLLDNLVFWVLIFFGGCFLGLCFYGLWFFLSVCWRASSEAFENWWTPGGKR
jgi:hypothetical protein